MGENINKLDHPSISTEIRDQIQSSGIPKYFNTSIGSSSDIFIADSSVGREIRDFETWSTMTTMVFYSDGGRLVMK